MQTPNRTFKHDPERIKNYFMNFNGGLMWLRRENSYLKNYDMSGREKTIKTPKTVKNIKNCSDHISKASRSLFARQFDIYIYIVNKVVKQDLKMTKFWAKPVPKSSLLT